MATTPTTRIATLDVLRGVAVMGILVANLPGFALPEAAYFSPLAWGGAGVADIVAWFTTFVLVEGKLRGLFSFLFGASMLLVIDRARASGQDPATVHFSRMAVLFAIGCAHLYLFWWGDILAHYALVGGFAYVFARLGIRWLIGIALLLMAVQTAGSAAGATALFDSAARDTPAAIAMWDGFALTFGVPPRAVLLAEIAGNRSGFLDAATWRWANAPSPIDGLPYLGPETLAAMLLGMAGYRSGFLTGGWTRARYRRWAIVCLGIALPAYVILGAITLAHGFDQRWIYLNSIVLSIPFRTLGFVGYAALLMLLIRPGGKLTERVAAVGRAAFTNYLGTTLLMTAIFSGWGLGLFGSIGRAPAYLFVPLVWAIMLAWSRPWLARYRFGPLEWFWRSVARWQWQPMRGTVNTTS